MRSVILIRLVALTVLLYPLSEYIQAEDGYRLWLRYEPITDANIRASYLKVLGDIECDLSERSPQLTSAVEELRMGLDGLIGDRAGSEAPSIWLGIQQNITNKTRSNLENELRDLGNEGYLVKEIQEDPERKIIITGNTNKGVLYGVFVFLRHLQMHRPIEGMNLSSSPKISNRLLNHWDNLTQTVERTMAGSSIWNWFDLPYYIEPHYTDYARACASIGINGTVLTNVNANATVLQPQFLEKVAALADTFRSYGIRVYLTARFSAPIEIGGLRTADPLDPQVQAWWNEKANEIYSYIPDFGGFLVKANSEGQPGPQNYGRNHADGANMLARALEPHGGIVMWRAFVYDFEVKEDRHKQAYTEFTQLDGQFLPNVLLQIKNGAIDFMPREPFHPLFGATPHTPQALELQITQEYMGGDVHLAYLAPMWKETLNADTFVSGTGSTVGRVIDGSLFAYKHSAIAGVSNVGNERNWTGHPMAAANWYAFGRLAWDHEIRSESIAEEWTRMTFNNDPEFVESVKDLLLSSHPAVVDYSMPLGLHHIMAAGHHYGPGPWHDQGRPDWTSTYYHQADEVGIGFDRTQSGSNALEQYSHEVVKKWGDPQQIEEEYLLWFHHISWEFTMPSGNSLWDELCLRYQRGVNEVAKWEKQWERLRTKVDHQRHARITALLKRQHQDAIFWKDACLSYFQTFSKRPIPNGVEKPARNLEYYMNFKLHHVPGDPAEQW